MRRKGYPRRESAEHRYQSATPLVIGQRTSFRPAEIPARWIAVAVGVLALVAVVLWFSFSPQFYIQGAEVVGATRVSPAAIYSASGIDRVHVLWVNRRAAANQITDTIPSIAEARVACRLWSVDCTLRVVEEPLMLTWHRGDQSFWVDEAGGIFAAEAPLEGEWEVRGPMPIDDAGWVERDVLDALRALERFGVSPRPIDYRDGRGLVITDGAGWRVVLGEDPERMEQRLRVYAEVREYLIEHDTRPRFVDVRFPEAPYYSETNDW
ncbi:MAG: cell division protein FtsQ/DivIB [Anaerolineae bacterium]|jgi:hypothetical protein